MDDYFDRLERHLGDLLEQNKGRRRLPSVHRPRGASTALALLLSVAIVAGVVAVALQTNGGGQPPVALQQPASGAIDPQLIRAFPILRRPVRTDDRLPPAFTMDLSGRLGVPAWQVSPAALGLDGQMAHRATISGTGFSAWLIPGRHGFCWDAWDSSRRFLGGMCGRSRGVTAVTDGIGVAYADGVTLGLVTHHVVSLQLVNSSGVRRSVPLADGFYAASSRPGDRLLARTDTGREVALTVVDLPGARGRAIPVPGSLVGQSALSSPHRATAPAGTAWISRSAGRYWLWVDASQMTPNTGNQSYALWLETSRGAALRLTSAAPVGESGRLTVATLLPPSFTRFSRLVITSPAPVSTARPTNVLLGAPIIISGR